MTKNLPLSVEIPRADQDRPQWVRIGVIAVLGFVLGVAWPRVTGLKVGPSVPADLMPAASPSARAEEPAPVASAAPGVAPSAALAVAHAASSAPAAGASAATETRQAPFHVRRGVMIGCKSESGEALKGKACGTVELEAMAQARLRKLADCPAVHGANGRLNVVVNLDFDKSKLTTDIGKSSTAPHPETFAPCVKSAFEGASLAGLAHDHPRYTINYGVLFEPAPGGGTANASNAPPTAAAIPTLTSATKPAEGTGTEIVWEVAIVRDGPKTGQVVARLPRGTRVKVGPAQDGWYKIGFGDGDKSEGFVYRGAIGK